MLKRITYRQLQRLTVKELEEELQEGGLVVVTVDSQARFVLTLYNEEVINKKPDIRETY